MPGWCGLSWSGAGRLAVALWFLNQLRTGRSPRDIFIKNKQCGSFEPVLSYGILQEGGRNGHGCIGGGGCCDWWADW